jgi:hypothetical protein
VQETAAGWRVDHRVGRHDDHVVAVALALAGLMGAPAHDPGEMGAEERAQVRALQREWGVAGAAIYDADGRLQEDNIVYDEDQGMRMDHPNYPRW